MKNQTVLVTGGTGFVGIHTILQLLQQGYSVKTTLRTLSKTQSIMDALKEAGLADLSKLSFFEADLTSDPGWKKPLKIVTMCCTLLPLFHWQSPVMRMS